MGRPWSPMSELGTTYGTPKALRIRMQQLEKVARRPYATGGVVRDPVAHLGDVSHGLDVGLIVPHDTTIIVNEIAELDAHAIAAAIAAKAREPIASTSA